MGVGEFSNTVVWFSEYRDYVSQPWSSVMNVSNEPRQLLLSLEGSNDPLCGVLGSWLLHWPMFGESGTKYVSEQKKILS